METAFFIRALPFFHGLSQSEIQVLCTHAHVKEYQKRATLFMQDDPADRFFIVMSGWIKMVQSTAEGNEAILGLFTRGDSFGEAILFDGADYPHSAEAVENAKVIELPAAILREMAQNNPEFSLRLMQSMTHHIQRLCLENEHLAVMTTTQRVGCFILQLCLGMERFDGNLTLPYDKHLAAARLGMKPETFSRALKDLRAYGVTVNKNDVFIEDQKKLEDFVCSNCSCSPENCLLAKHNLCGKCQTPKAA